MLRAVLVRTLKEGVTYEQRKGAWVPEGVDAGYPARTCVGRNVSDERQVITVLELDTSIEDFEAIRGSLTRPDARGRLGAIVETTELGASTKRSWDPRPLAR